MTLPHITKIVWLATDVSLRVTEMSGEWQFIRLSSCYYAFSHACGIIWVSTAHLSHHLSLSLFRRHTYGFLQKRSVAQWGQTHKEPIVLYDGVLGAIKAVHKILAPSVQVDASSFKVQVVKMDLVFFGNSDNCFSKAVIHFCEILRRSIVEVAVLFTKSTSLRESLLSTGQ